MPRRGARGGEPGAQQLDRLGVAAEHGRDEPGEVGGRAAVQQAGVGDREVERRDEQVGDELRRRPVARAVARVGRHRHRRQPVAVAGEVGQEGLHVLELGLGVGEPASHSEGRGPPASAGRRALGLGVLSAPGVTVLS